MQNKFVIIDKRTNSDRLGVDLEVLFQNEYFLVYGDNKKNSSFLKHKIIVDGYAVAINSFSNQFNGYEQVELVHWLYRKYGDEFVNYLKGIFTIIVVDNGVIKLFTDQLGISKFFYSAHSNKYCISNNYNFVSQFEENKEINKEVLAVKALLNREVNGESLISNIYYSKPATKLIICNNQFKISEYWNHSMLLQNINDELDIEYFSNLFIDNVVNYQNTLKPSQAAITLTGGKDSRTALAAMLNIGTKPFGITYGNPQTRDVVYAAKLANDAGIDHLVFNPPRNFEWFNSAAQDILNLNNPLINIHRSHRLYAFNLLKQQLGSDISFYSGYMGGELLMGVYFDNLIFTNFVRDYWQNGDSLFLSIPNLLQERFVKSEELDIDSVINRLKGLKCFDSKIGYKEKQFNSLFEIGVMHHSQDLQVAKQIFNYPVPFFLDIEFVQALFASKYSFFYQDVETKNLFKRHSLYRFNLLIQHLLYPGLDKTYFAKKGTYNTTEFLRGSVYWTIVKALRYFFERRKYPATFSYNYDYKKFLLEQFVEIIRDSTSPIHQIYDVSKAFQSLQQQNNIPTESPLHKYSNIVMHYMQMKQFA